MIYNLKSLSFIHNDIIIHVDTTAKKGKRELLLFIMLFISFKHLEYANALSPHMFLLYFV